MQYNDLFKEMINKSILQHYRELLGKHGCKNIEWYGVSRTIVFMYKELSFKIVLSSSKETFQIIEVDGKRVIH